MNDKDLIRFMKRSYDIAVEQGFSTNEYWTAHKRALDNMVKEQKALAQAERQQIRRAEKQGWFIAAC